MASWRRRYPAQAVGELDLPPPAMSSWKTLRRLLLAAGMDAGGVRHVCLLVVEDDSAAIGEVPREEEVACPCGTTFHAIVRLSGLTSLYDPTCLDSFRVIDLRLKPGCPE